MSDYFFYQGFEGGWWNVRCICFRFGRPRTAVPERANRSDENIMFPAFPLRYCWSFPLFIRIEYGVSSDNFNFWPSSRLNSQLGFSCLLMFHCSAQTRVARTPTFFEFVHWLFWLLCCVLCTVRFGYSCAKGELLLDLESSLDISFQFASPSRFSLLTVFWLGQFWVLTWSVFFFGYVYFGHSVMFWLSQFGLLTWSV